MDNIAVLQAVVTADITDFESQLNKVEARAKQTSGFLEGMGDFGHKLTMGLTLPLVGAGIAIAKVGSDFNAEMRNINSLLQLSEDKFVDFGVVVNETGSATIYGANKTADALYTIVSAGIGIKDTADAMTLLGVATTVAASGKDDLDRTTMALIALHENFRGLYTDERIGDVVANMVQAGAGPLSSYTQNMAKVAPTAAMLGMSLEELGSDIAQLSLTYGNGSKPMTAMGMLMSNLIKPNLTLQEGLHNLGVNGFKELMVKAGGLNEALFMLKGSMSEFDFNKSFSKTGFEAAALLTNDIDNTRASLLEFQATVGGAAERAYVEQMKSFESAFDKAKSAIEGVAVVLSQTLLPILTPIFDGVSMLATAFIAADPALQSAVVIFGMMAAAIGPVIWAVASLLSVLNPVTVAVGLLAAAVGTNFGGIKDKIVSAATAAWEALKPLANIMTNLIELMSYKFDPVGDMTPDLPDWSRVMGNTTIPDPARYIKVDKPTNVWDLYKQRGYDKEYSWEEFKEQMLEGGWRGGNIAIKPSDVITFGDPGDISKVAIPHANHALAVVMTTFGDVFKAGNKGGNQGGWFGSGMGMDQLGVMDFIHNEEGLKMKIETEMAGVFNSVAAAVPGMLQGLSAAFGMGAGYIGNAIVDMFRKVWGFFTSGQAEGGPDILAFVNTNIVQPFLTAFNAAWPTMQVELAGLWTQITGWFDSKLGAGLNLLAGLFSGTQVNGGNTNVYEAVKALLEGDIYRAIDEIIPGAGTKLQEAIGGDWGAKIGGAFPQIQAGLVNLLGQFGAWFTNDAIPTIAKSIGYFGGKVGVLIGQAVGAIGGFLTGASTGVDGGDVVAGFRDTATIIGEGFQEALTDSGVGVQAEGGSLASWANQIVTGIAGALGTAVLAMGAFAAFQKGLWAGIGAAMQIPTFFGVKAMNMATAVATKAVGFLGTAVANAFALAPLLTVALGGVIVTTVLTKLYLNIPDEVKASLQSSLQGMISDVFNLDGAGEAVSRGLERGLYWAAREKARVEGNTAGVTYFDGLIAGIDAQQAAWKGTIINPTDQIAKFGDLGRSASDMWSFKSPISYDIDGVNIDQSIMDQWRIALANTREKMALEGGTWSNEVMVQQVNAMNQAAAVVFKDPLKADLAFQMISGNFEPVDPALFESMMDTFLGSFTWEELAGKKLEWDGANFTLVPATVNVDPSQAQVVVTGAAPSDWAVTGVPSGWGNFGVNPNLYTAALPEGGLPKITADSFIDPTTPANVKKLGDETILAISDTTAQFGEKVAGMVADGTLDPESVNENFLVPLSTYWTSTFGAEGLLATATTAFATTFTTQLGLVDTAFVTTVTGATTQLTLFTDTLTMKKEEIATILGTLGETAETSLARFGVSFQTVMTQVGMYVTNMAAKIHGLITEMNSLGTLAATGGGGGMLVNGSHKGGLDSVPYDGYVAELHKKEMVLTADQAAEYRSPQTSISNSSTKNVSTSSSVTVNVYGGDTDKLLAELKRRGVKIG